VHLPHLYLNSEYFSFELLFLIIILTLRNVPKFHALDSFRLAHSSLFPDFAGKVFLLAAVAGVKLGLVRRVFHLEVNAVSCFSVGLICRPKNLILVEGRVSGAPEIFFGTVFVQPRCPIVICLIQGRGEF